MELKVKPFSYKGHEYGTSYYYDSIVPELIPREFGVRVLPAQYYSERRTLFTLIKRYEPGENKYFPNGGYDVRDEGGGQRSFKLDEVVIHPSVSPAYKRYFDHIDSTLYAATEIVTGEPVVKIKGKRGRKPLDPNVKAAREAEKARKRLISGGKRGRPKKIIS